MARRRQRRRRGLSAGGRLWASREMVVEGYDAWLAQRRPSRSAQHSSRQRELDDCAYIAFSRVFTPAHCLASMPLPTDRGHRPGPHDEPRLESMPHAQAALAARTHARTLARPHFVARYPLRDSNLRKSSERQERERTVVGEAYASPLYCVLPITFKTTRHALALRARPLTRRQR